MTLRPSVLVVENDQAVREAVALVLHQIGYEVVLAESGKGAEALVLIAELAALDGLYTDIELNDGVSGWKVGARFHSTWPNKTIVYASASHHRPPRLLGNEIFLRKPFEAQALWNVFRPIPAT
jgi:CheY-like chemotaxis protein